MYLTWEDARNHCRSLKSFLVELNSDLELESLHTLYGKATKAGVLEKYPLKIQRLKNLTSKQDHQFPLTLPGVIDKKVKAIRK